GPSGTSFGTWSRTAGQWRGLGRFGSTQGHNPAFVSGVNLLSGGVLAAVTDGDSYSLWTSRDGQNWRQLATPVQVRSGTEHVLTTATSGSAVLVITDDAVAGKAWLC